MTAEAPSWLRGDGDGCRLSLHVQPRAKESAICGLHNGRLRVRLQAPPLDGRANRELMRLLRRQLQVPKSALELVAGEHSREKVVHVYGVPPAAIRESLGLTGTANS